MEIPKNQIEFEKMFSDENQCLAYLKELRFPDGYLCRKCKHGEHWLNIRRILVCKKCKDELSLTGTHQNFVGEKYLSYYLDEYTFRYNRRKSKSRGLLFQRLVEQGVVHEPVEYKSIKCML